MVKRGSTKKSSAAEGKPPEQGHPEAGAVESSRAQKARKAFEIDIFRGWCKSCGICAAFCPRDCIGTDENGSPVVTDADRCSGCGWCELHCPDFAVSVRPRLARAGADEND